MLVDPPLLLDTSDPLEDVTASYLEEHSPVGGRGSGWLRVWAGGRAGGQAAWQGFPAVLVYVSSLCKLRPYALLSHMFELSSLGSRGRTAGCGGVHGRHDWGWG